MASSPNFEHRKCPKFEQYEDRISRLPDEILCHILSFLPPEDFVRTSIFSKRWTHIWTSVPIIEISSCSRMPADFVDRVLALNVSCFRKFSFQSSDHPPSRVREWLRAAFMRDVEELDLSLYSTGHLDPKDIEELLLSFLSFFTSKILVILKLSDWHGNPNFIINLSAAVVSLPSLKILHLRSVQFSDDDSMNNLIDGCPVLEELYIRIEHDNSKTLRITSNSLKRLNVCTGYSCSMHIRFNIVLNTKNLEQLDFEYHDTVQYDVNSLSSLAKVNLTGCTNCSRKVVTDVYGAHSRLVELIRKFSNTMFLSCEYIPSSYESDLPLFHLEFPLSVFTSNKLVILKLKDWRRKQNILVNLPAAAVSLPRLKILHLRSVQFLDDNSMNNLIDGCPVLEELDIEVGHDNSKTLTIRSDSLKSVRVGWYSCSITIQFKIVLDTKNLERLDLVYHLMVLYDVSNLSALEKVNLTGCENCSSRIGTDIHGNHSRLVELIRKLSRTKYMFLSCENILGHLESSLLNDLHLPMFHNLTHLKLDRFKDSWKILPYLFEKLPSLKTFDFHRVRFCKGRWRQPCRQFHAPECLMLNLDEVKLTGFRACADEMVMVSYFLKSATSLKKISIQSSYRGSQKMLEISQQLLTFERGSNKCQIIFN